MPCRGCGNNSTTCIEAQKNAFFLKKTNVSHTCCSATQNTNVTGINEVQARVARHQRY